MKIAVVGTSGGWSSERLADAVEAATGYRLLVDMAKIRLSLPDGRIYYENNELSALDGILIKKIGSPYFPDLLDRLETLRYLSEKGMPTLQTGGIPMPPTTITEDIDAALTAVAEYGEAVFKPLYSPRRGVCALLRIMAEQGRRLRRIAGKTSPCTSRKKSTWASMIWVLSSLVETI